MADDIETIVQRMIDAGESEENIASVIKLHSIKTSKPLVEPYTGPSDYWSGVGQHFTSGDFLDTTGKALKGYAKGALLDLPGSIVGGAKTVLSHTFDLNPLGLAMDIGRGLRDTATNVWETGKQSGSDPEAFGRAMGQVTGQPLATEGLIKAAPMVPPALRATKRVVSAPIRALGKPVELAGDAAIAASPIAPWGYRTKTALAGLGVRKFGQMMKEFGISPEEANATALKKFYGEVKPGPAPPTKLNIIERKPDIWDEIREERNNPSLLDKTPKKSSAIIQHSPSNPGTLRGSLDGGQTWKYSTDGGENWSMDEPGNG